MYIDAFTIAALVDEFMDRIVGGRVQDAVVVDATGIGLEIYANRERHYLYLSADTNAPRVHLVDTRLRRGMPKPTQLALLIRRYVRGGRLVHVSQPPHERILHLHFEGGEGDTTLIIEPMPRRSNLILVQNDVILDCARRIGPDDNRYRITLPAHDYIPPPPLENRFDPATLTRDQLETIFDENDQPKTHTHRVIGSRLYGFSPLIAKEVIHLAGLPINQKARDADRDSIYHALVAFIEPLSRREWQPGIVRQPDDDIPAFSVYPITHLPGWQPTETVSAALTHYYGTPSGPDGYKIAKKPVRESLKEAIIREQAKLKSLQSALHDQTDIDALKQRGDLILAYQYMLAKGQTEFEAQYDPAGEPLHISLDPKLTPIENAQRYFRKYEKAKRAQTDMPNLIQQTQHRLDYLTNLQTDIDLAGNWSEIDEVRQQLSDLGYWHGKQPRKIAGSGKSQPLRLITDDEFVIFVGRNSRQNDQVTFGKGSADDLWLHARDVPGSHVVIKYDGRDIPETVILKAAAIAAYYSRRRNEGNVIVDVTQCKHVRKIKGAAPGMVTYRNEETRAVRPQDEAEIGLAE